MIDYEWEFVECFSLKPAANSVIPDDLPPLPPSPILSLATPKTEFYEPQETLPVAREVAPPPVVVHLPSLNRENFQELFDEDDPIQEVMNFFQPIIFIASFCITNTLLSMDLHLYD